MSPFVVQSGKEACKGNVRYCAVGRIADRVLIATYLHYTAGPDTKKYLAVSQKILNSDKVLSQQSANVPNAVEDSSCLMQADKNYMYIVFIAKDYPERTGFELARQIRKEFNDKEAANAASATENSLSKSCKKWMSAACTKYDDVSSINKVAEVQAKVDDVKMTMESNVKDMINQHAKLEDLEDKAEDMRSEASKFKKNATKLASHMWWKNCRMCAIIVIVSLIVILIIVMSLCAPCRGEK